MLAAIDRVLTPGRAKLAALIVLGGSLATTAIWLATLHGLMDVFHQPLGGDFIIFYSASKLTLAGHAHQVYDPRALYAAQQAVISAIRPGLEWCYPPTFQLVIAPLGLLPFAAAYALFVGATLGAYLLLIRAIAPGRWPLILACAFPGAFVNALQGQNGFLTTALLGYGLLALDRRPWLAGAALGLLAYKPQFAVLLPVLLIGTGRFKSVAGAALSALAFIGLSALVFGEAQWLAFFRTLPEVSAALAAGKLPFAKIPTVFAALACLGVPRAESYALQAVVAALAAGTTLLAWRSQADHGLKVALAMVAVFLVSPYAFNYDLVVLAVPIALAARYGQTAPLPDGTKAALLLAAFTPNLFLGFAKATHVQLMPAAIIVLFAALCRLLWRAQRPSLAARRTPAIAALSPGAQNRLV